MRIELLGASFSIQTDEDPAYLAEVVELYRQKVSEIQRSVSTQDNLKVAILAGILTADAYLKKSGSEGATTEVGLITAQLITELEDALGEDRRSAGTDSPGEQNGQPPSDLGF